MAQTHDHENHAAVAVAGQEAAMSDGEIKKVDKDTGRLTIKHGPLENLGMPGMTMVFGVKDMSALDVLKAGDKIKFVAEKLEGRYVVTQLAVQE
ncbi:copper-binding protein [Massilia aurea]|nr:copper-binding protein [Massilia aurea]MCS0710128.1 copper-binding protein [Massilia aurea]